MRKLILLAIIAFFLAQPVYALEIQAPPAPNRVSDMVDQPADSFAQGLWNVIKSALAAADSALGDAMAVCLAAASAALICALLGNLTEHIPGKSLELCSTAAVAGILLAPSTALIHLGTETGAELSEYGLALLPVMSGAMAAQGGVTSAAAIYTGTAVFDSLLGAVLSKLMIPMVWLFLALAIAHSALGESLLGRMKGFTLWLMGWILKLVLYLFSGYIAVTGVVSGSADAMAVRATKAAISTAVPVVGGILSDASETVLVTAGVLGSAAGVYGLLTVLALFSGPFARIGLQYLLLKGTGTLCSSFGGCAGKLIEDFAGAMGLILGMIGTQTVLLMVSTLCFMKGVG